MTKEQIKKAAKILKVRRLVNSGLDAVAVKLNCEPTPIKAAKSLIVDGFGYEEAAVSRSRRIEP